MSSRWDPFRDLITLQEHLNRLFDVSVGQHRHGEDVSGWHPPADISESERDIHIYIEVAGMDADSFDLRVENDRLIIRGERVLPHRVRQVFHQSEILAGPFHRIFKLPSNVDPDGIQASYRQGILEVVLIKREEPASTKVPIKIR